VQFGIFSIGDISPDPTTGDTQSEAKRIRNLVTIAAGPTRSAWTWSLSANTTTRRS
jgi:hypothetical protein